MSAQVAIVTGASRGIGAHLVCGLAAQGWQVVGLSRSGALPQGCDSPDVVARPCDVNDPAAVAEAVEAVVADFGAVDLLVNNAGVIETEQPLWASEVDEWWRVIETNVRGPYVVSRAVVPHMLAAGGGRIVNINSGSGTREDPTLSAYTASKSALARITGSLHAAGFERGLRAFDLAPGVVQTDMTAGMQMHVGRTDWTAPQTVIDFVLALASGELDAFSGRMVRAGSDDLDTLREHARAGLPDGARMLRLRPWGDDDPVA